MLHQEIFLSKKGLSCIACKSECYTNTTKIVSTFSEITVIDLTNFKEKKSEDSLSETNSRKFSPIPFRLPLLESDSTQPGTNTVSPLSVPDDESMNSCELNEKGKEKKNSATSKTIEVEEDPLPPNPEVSHSVEGDLRNYKPTPMDVKLVDVFDCEYLRNNDGAYLDGKIVDDKVWQERYRSIIIYPLSQYDLPTNGPI